MPIIPRLPRKRKKEDAESFSGKKRNWKTERRKERQRAYHTKEWSELSKQLRMEHPICEECGKNLSTCVHHIKSPFKRGLTEEEKKELLLDRDNLRVLCTDCHVRIHEEIRQKFRKK